MGIQKYPRLNKIKFTMSGTQSKIARQAKKQAITMHNQKKSKSQYDPCDSISRQDIKTMFSYI